MSKSRSQRCYILVKKLFKGDNKKTVDWFHEPNTHLGGIRPIEMINKGRSDKLLMFIQSSINENHI